MNSSFAIKSLSDSLIGLHELVKLLSQLFVLNGDDSDMVV